MFPYFLFCISIFLHLYFFNRRIPCFLSHIILFPFLLVFLYPPLRIFNLTNIYSVSLGPGALHPKRHKGECVGPDFGLAFVSANLSETAGMTSAISC